VTLGITKQQYTSYIWPPDVRVVIDKDRRRLPTTEIKRLLKEKRLETPIEYNDGWWKVYDLQSMGMVLYDPKAKRYGIVRHNQEPIVFSSIEEVIREQP
jgi:hypothetical protein